MQVKDLSVISRLALVLSSLLMIIAIFVPLWRIELAAPQYPEGLILLIFTNKLAGSVDIINGLNHYIGMQTLHAENFIEFTILPYIFAIFAILFLYASVKGTRKSLYISFISLAIFGIIAMIDFWRWEYNYGHHLDPNAAIIVPGMAYQPPLIGFKQLLNFGAYSIPDIGGWSIVFVGLVLLAAVMFETGYWKKLIPNRHTKILLVLGLFSICSCSTQNPVLISIHKDNCDYCKMSVADLKFACELITSKGRIHKFDDLSCMNRYIAENKSIQFASFWFYNCINPTELINANDLQFIKSDHINGPMGGKILACKDSNACKEQIHDPMATHLKWAEIFRSP